ncbi:MAG: PP2C family protein-serine/threonine phosphatase [Anaerolineales bacterium]
MEVQFAVAKINKYAVSESGDTLEVVERPHGGVSIVLADGQTSGRGAKAISILVVRKVISLLAEGVHDGTAARAASDYLFTEKNGKVSCTLNIVSIDLRTQTVVLTSNSSLPVFVMLGEKIDALNVDSKPIGVARNTHPVITEIPLEGGLTVVVYTDGLVHAGTRGGQPMDILTTLHGLLDENDPAPQEVADVLLAQALRLDDNRPVDDISVVVLRVMPRQGDEARRMTMRLPFQSG